MPGPLALKRNWMTCETCSPYEISIVDRFSRRVAVQPSDHALHRILLPISRAPRIRGESVCCPSQCIQARRTVLVRFASVACQTREARAL